MSDLRLGVFIGRLLVVVAVVGIPLDIAGVWVLDRLLDDPWHMVASVLLGVTVGFLCAGLGLLWQGARG